MRKSIFFKLALILIPVVLVCELVQLYISYRTIYDSNLKTVSKLTESTSLTVSEMFRYFDEDSENDQYEYGLELSRMCETWGVTYIYALDVDIDKRSEKYLAIGFGEDAAEIVKKSRYAGVVVQGTVSDAQIQAYRNKENSFIVHEKTELDDTITCYSISKDKYDYTNYKIVKRDKPILIGAEVSFSAVMKESRQRFFSTATYDLIFTFMLTLAIFIVFYLRVNGPVRRISSRMKNFVSDRDKGVEKLKVRGNDELAEMSRSFNLMTEEINSYITSIDSLNKEKHTQEAELDIARNIQTGLLKPGNYENGSVSINACMHAAKNVGGDLYDYQVFDDGRVFICVADVSGKGISAALFMSRAITLLHQYALHDYSPSRMLREYNNTLAEQNPNGMFITTFAAVYDPKTHQLTYSNAGHNHPYVIADKLIELDGASGVAAGIFEGMEYEQETITLHPGDVVFLYTDGVNEAENSNGEMYGTEALENELRKYIGAAKGNISDEVLSTVREFSGHADQSDDITILTLKLEQASLHDEITVKNQVENLKIVIEKINALDINEETKAQLLLIAEELFVNICSYAYKGKDGDITFVLDIGNDQASMIFTDEGEPFDPTADLIDIEEYDHENSIGGLGRFLAFELADEYSYAYENGKNTLKIIKKI